MNIGSSIHKVTGKAYKTFLVKEALAHSDVLSRSGYIAESAERRETFEQLLPKIAAYLDGNAEIIQSSVRDYFRDRHVDSGFKGDQFEITFAPKPSGKYAISLLSRLTLLKGSRRGLFARSIMGAARPATTSRLTSMGPPRTIPRVLPPQMPRNFTFTSCSSILALDLVSILLISNH